MPCFHWPRTCIHENMWNSKSCPEGLPHQKDGAVASRQTPANSNAREIGVLSSLSFTLMLCRDAGCRVSRGRDGQAQGQLRLYRPSNSIALENSRKINRSGIIQKGVASESAMNEVEPTTGVWTGTKDGVQVWFPVSWRDHWLWRVMERTSIGWGGVRAPGQPEHPRPRKTPRVVGPGRGAVPSLTLGAIWLP